jgi:hypothetical protein
MYVRIPFIMAVLLFAIPVRAPAQANAILSETVIDEPGAAIAGRTRVIVLSSARSTICRSRLMRSLGAGRSLPLFSRKAATP